MWTQTFLLLAACFSPQDSIQVIPKPTSVSATDGSWTPEKGLAIRYDHRVEAEAKQLKDWLAGRLGFEVELLREELRKLCPQEIYLDLQEEDDTAESYSLVIEDGRVRIEGVGGAGVFYGIQTLKQLVAPEGPVAFPNCEIEDEPRFRWRGMHLDVGRHTFAAADIEKFLDWMALHKLNTFHWHLTEDQGWRIEVKKYPLLTEVGAFRDSTPPYGDRKGSDGKRYGGFYTQEEVRRIVAHAAALHITIVPEIDMPGHMSAAIAAYPELGNDDIEGYAPKVQSKWGVHRYVLAPKESTFEWVDNVLAEVCELFPGEYVHIGGDEAPKDQWKASAFAQSVMKREGLADEHELQSYFIGRVSKLLEKRGKRLMGWDEIREGGLAEGATVMVWRGWHNAIEAAQQGHDVVMAPTSHTYFDYYQADAQSELARGAWYECIGGNLPLQKVYSLDPVPSELSGKPEEAHILGTQAQLWTEYGKTWEKVEYLAFPRIAALSEVAWTQPDNKDWVDFQKRLKPMLQRYRLGGVRYFEPAAKEE
ncbi:MAG: beta-N-acetylhexosaminidase [Planctomycetes bacterium]|nr:beta-N-acetylhexosaminidase [Planctomycetota bacterium]